jgi:hydrogenase small subunit
LDGRHRRLPECRGNLHWLYNAGIPDKFMPFMDEPPGARISSTVSNIYGGIRSLRRITDHTVNKEPKWRHPGRKLTTGYQPRTY